MSDHLFQRNGRSKVWYATYYDADGVRHTRSTRQLDKRAAAATLREWERREADPSYAPANQTTVGDALAGLIRDRRLKGRAEGTIDCYRVKAGHLTRLLGAELPLRRVTAKVVDAFVDARLDEGAKRNTIHKELTVLRGALKVAKRRGEFPDDIAAVMPDGFSTEYKPRETYQTAAEARALLIQLEPDRTARVAFLIATGARWGESDRARHVDLALTPTGGIVRLRGTKTMTSERRVPVVGFAVDLLAHCLAHCAGTDGLLFTPWANVRRDLAAACKRAGIPAVTPNDLRRTCGTWWRQLEVEPHLIGSLLGHGDSRMVERVYGRMPAESLGKALERRLPAPAADPLKDSTAGAANLSGTGGQSGRGGRRRAPKTPVNVVSEDGIEPPTRGFSVPNLVAVKGRNHKGKPAAPAQVQRGCSKSGIQGRGAGGRS
jgi:integrase